MRQAWRERPEAGTVTVIRASRTLVRLFGRTLSRSFLVLVCAYFLLRRGPERRASRNYLSRVLGRRASWYDVGRHFFAFATTTLDRVYLLTESFRRFSITVSGLAELHAALESGKGVLLFGSHLGSFDALRVLSLQHPEIAVRIVLDVEQNPAISDTLNALHPGLANTIINARMAGPALALAIREALDRNAIVALLADRARPGNAMMPAQFLGDAAPFPQAPWLLAAALRTPVFLSFGLYCGGNRYALYFERFADSLRIERTARNAELGQIVQRFADRLSHYARMAPFNWFNFYDFWTLPDALSASPRDHGGAGRAGA